MLTKFSFSDTLSCSINTSSLISQIAQENDSRANPCKGMAKSMNPNARLALPLTTWWAQTSFLISLNFSFFIYKTGVIKRPTSQGCCEGSVSKDRLRAAPDRQQAFRCVCLCHCRLPPCHDYTLKRTSATTHSLWPEGVAAGRSQTSLVCRVPCTSTYSSGISPILQMRKPRLRGAMWLAKR